ncbi:unnamed protein product, partial [Larinioides sclopetarius]
MARRCTRCKVSQICPGRNPPGGKRTSFRPSPGGPVLRSSMCH